jgi:hypothetical protein
MVKTMEEILAGTTVVKLKQNRVSTKPAAGAKGIKNELPTLTH